MTIRLNRLPTLNFEEDIYKKLADARRITDPSPVQVAVATPNAVGGGSASGGNPLDALKIDQAGGGPTTYSTLAGAINGVNKTFTTSVPYKTGTLEVTLRGTDRAQGTDQQLWAELDPDAGTFVFTLAPITNDWIKVKYQENVNV